MHYQHSGQMITSDVMAFFTDLFIKFNTFQDGFTDCKLNLNKIMYLHDLVNIFTSRPYFIVIHHVHVLGIG